MPSFANLLIKTIIVCCLVLAPLSAIAWTNSSKAAIKQHISRPSVKEFNKRGCQQLAHESSRITKKSCMAREHKGKKQLLAMLQHSNHEQRERYWAECDTHTRFGPNNYGINYVAMAKCIRYTKAKCPPNPPGPRRRYAECLRAIDNQAFLSH